MLGVVLRVLIDDIEHDYHSIWMEEKIICAIDQRKLPFAFEIFKAASIDDVCFAIKDMVVRGAPLIGATAAYGLLQASITFDGDNNEKYVQTIVDAGEKLAKTRPTAVDLFNTISRIKKSLDTAVLFPYLNYEHMLITIRD